MKFSTNLVDLLAASDFVGRLKNDSKVVMDNTEFTDWNSCFVKGLYSGGWRRVPVRGMAPLLFGQAVHTGMAALLRKQGLKAALELSALDCKKTNLDSLLDPRRNSSTLAELLTAYAAHIDIVPSERIVPLELDGTLVVEQSFSFPLGDITFEAGELFAERVTINVYWSGILDCLAYYQNEIWVVDHKTTSVMGDKFSDDKLRSSQMLGYVRSARLFQDRLSRPIRGVLINALALRKNDFEFKHFPLPMAEWKIDEWHSETLLAVRNIIKSTVEFLTTGEAVPIREHCVTKYGKCKFFDMCESVPVVRERMLFDESWFTKNLWNPLE